MAINMITRGALYNKVVQRYLMIVSTYRRYALICVSVDMGVSEVKNLILYSKNYEF